MAEAVTVTVQMANGEEVVVEVTASTTVDEVRQLVLEQVKPASTVTDDCFVRLLSGNQLLQGGTLVSDVDLQSPVFGIVVESLDLQALQALAADSPLYAEAFACAALKVEGDQVVATMRDLPSILEVYQDVGGQLPTLEAACHDAATGHFAYWGNTGEMLLPSLSAGPLHEAMGTISKVVIEIGVNSDNFNNGLGVVVEAAEDMTRVPDEPARQPRSFYVYCSSLSGLSETRARNAVKFHPGMHGGELRVEGRGGFPNQNVGFRPAAWQEGNRLHTLKLELGADGTNAVTLVDATNESRMWTKRWRHQLFDGVNIPALYTWLDCARNQHSPVYYGRVSIVAYADAPEGAGMPVDAEG